MRKAGAILFLLMGVSFTSQALTLEMGQCDTSECRNLFENYKKYARTHSDAATILGEMYLLGYGTEADEEQALKYFQRASAWRSTEGTYKAGLLLVERGATEDVEKGIDYLRQAAKEDNVHAIYFMGTILSDARYGNPDYAEADKWLAKSTLLRHPKINDPLVRLREEGKLTRDFFPATLEAIHHVNSTPPEKSALPLFAPRAAPEDGMEVIAVNGPDLTEFLNMGITLFRDLPNDINSMTTGTRVVGRTCEEVVNCTSTSIDDFRRLLNYIYF